MPSLEDNPLLLDVSHVTVRVSRNLKPLQAKMVKYRDNGVRLGWLINPQQQSVESYRLGQDVEILQSPTTLSGKDLLPEFSLDLAPIWA